VEWLLEYSRPYLFITVFQELKTFHRVYFLQSSSAFWHSRLDSQ